MRKKLLLVAAMVGLVSVLIATWLIARRTGPLPTDWQPAFLGNARLRVQPRPGHPPLGPAPMFRHYSLREPPATVLGRVRGELSGAHGWREIPARGAGDMSVFIRPEARVTVERSEQYLGGNGRRMDTTEVVVVMDPPRERWFDRLLRRFLR